MIYFVENENSNTLVKEYLTDNKIDFCIWDKWKFEQGKSIFVLPSGKFLLISVRGASGRYAVKVHGAEFKLGQNGRLSTQK